MRFYLFIVTAILLFSCNKEEGCTDCNALNFNPNADKNDNTCLYSNENRIGLYSVSDSMTVAIDSISWSALKCKASSRRSSSLLVT